MKFFQERKRKKLLSELKSRRHAEDDLLSPALRLRFDGVIDELASAPVEEIDQAVEKARKEYSALPLPRRSKLFVLLDLLVVVGAVAFGLRGLFFQPFRIPTGSMQPTLYGMHYQKSEGNVNPGFNKVPAFLHSLIFGTVPADAVYDGNAAAVVREISAGSAGIIFDYSSFLVGNKRYELPGSPRQAADYAKFELGDEVLPGEVIADGYMTVGDHLFVERVSMYLKEPARGDVIVFNTEGLSVDSSAGKFLLEQTGGYYYIKRLAALPGDTVKIVDDQLYVRPAGAKKFSKIQELDPRFEKVYSGKGGYQGHCNLNDEKDYRCMNFALGEEYTIPADHYLMLGDNTKFSLDSRYFGPVPRANLIGRAWIVFYPFSRRMGTVDRHLPVDEATGKPGHSTFETMSLQ